MVAECAVSEKRKSFICERDIGECWAECAMNEKRKSFICERDIGGWWQSAL